MSNVETAQETATKGAPKSAKDQESVKAAVVAPNLRKKKKAEGRKKRSLKLKADQEFSKRYFEGKSKRSTDKKAAFRKKKNKKK
jgi:hypothetical protein